MSNRSLGVGAIRRKITPLLAGLALLSGCAESAEPDLTGTWKSTNGLRTLTVLENGQAELTSLVASTDGLGRVAERVHWQPAENGQVRIDLPWAPGTERPILGDSILLPGPWQSDDLYRRVDAAAEPEVYRLTAVGDVPVGAPAIVSDPSDRLVRVERAFEGEIRLDPRLGTFERVHTAASMLTGREQAKRVGADFTPAEARAEPTAGIYTGEAGELTFTNHLGGARAPGGTASLSGTTLRFTPPRGSAVYTYERVP